MSKRYCYLVQIFDSEVKHNCEVHSFSTQEKADEFANEWFARHFGASTFNIRTNDHDSVYWSIVSKIDHHKYQVHMRRREIK